MSLFLTAAIVASGLSAGSLVQDVRELNCSGVDSYSGRAINLGRYSVMRETRQPGPFELSISGDFDASGLVCARTSAIPQPNDYKVALSGLILFVTSRRNGQLVRTALFVEDDQFVLQVLEGRLTQAEREQARERIQSYYEAVNANLSG